MTLSLALILYSCFFAYLLSGIVFVMFSPFLHVKKCVYFYQEFINYLHDNNHKTNLSSSLMTNDYLLIDYNWKFLKFFKLLCLFFTPIISVYNAFVKKYDISYVKRSRDFIDSNYSEDFKISNQKYNINPLFNELLQYGCAIYSVEKRIIEKLGIVLADLNKDLNNEINKEEQQERKDKS